MLKKCLYEKPYIRWTFFRKRDNKNSPVFVFRLCRKANKKRRYIPNEKSSFCNKKGILFSAAVQADVIVKGRSGRDYEKTLFLCFVSNQKVFAEQNNHRFNDFLNEESSIVEPTCHRSVCVLAVKGDIGALSFREQKANYFHLPLAK